MGYEILNPLSVPADFREQHATIGGRAPVKEGHKRSMNGDSPAGRDSLGFRDALGRFPTGVCVITAVTSDGHSVGVTVSSFASLSLEPPLVLFCLGLRTDSLDAYASQGSVCVNVLSEAQRDISEAFAMPGTDKFANVSHRTADNGCRLIEDSLVSLECSVVNEYVGGDHLIITARVERIHRGSPAQPLLRFRGRYARLGKIL